MTCPVCGGKLIVYSTYTYPDTVVRYRRCKKCRATVKTVEAK